jgi:hypothetical protein
MIPSWLINFHAMITQRDMHDVAHRNGMEQLKRARHAQGAKPSRPKGGRALSAAELSAALEPREERRKGFKRGGGWF